MKMILKNKNSLQGFLSIGVMLLLASCVSMRSAPVAQQVKTESPQARQQQLSQIIAWQIKGATAVKTSHNAFSASVFWQQRSAKQYRLTLMGPLSMGAVELVGVPGRVTLKRDNGDVYVSPSPEQLMQQQLGWQVPLSDLYYWVRGLPAPGTAITRYDRYGRLSYLKQAGWTVSYLTYTEVGAVNLPSKLLLNSHYANVKFVISDWQLSR